MRHYDPSMVIIIYDGVVITGLAEDSFVSAERSEDNFTEYVGVHGEVSHSESANKTGEVTITLESTSPAVPMLNAAANRGTLSNLSVVDMNDNGTNVNGTEARVRKPADREWGKEIGEVEFTFFVADFQME